MNDQNDQDSDETCDDVLAGLRQLAGRLEEERFPGRAWMAPPGVNSTNAEPCGPMLTNSRAPRRRAHWFIALTTGAVLLLGVGWLPTPRWRTESSVPIAQVDQEVVMPAPVLDWDSFVESPFVNFTGSEEMLDERGAELVVVEDFDSYSIIDFSNGAPLISYIRKDLNNVVEIAPDILERGGG